MSSVLQKKESFKENAAPLLRASVWSSQEVSLRLPANLALWTHIAILFPLSLFLCFYNLDTGAIWGSYTAVDEARHIRVAQEMWLSGQWWLPTLDNIPYFLKPPFKMWLTLIPAHLLGESTFSYRLIDATLGVGLIGLCYLFAVVLFRNFWAGLLSALFLLGNQVFFFVHGVRSAVQDTMMLFLTSLAMLIAWNFFKQLTENKNSFRQGKIAGLLLGLAAMTKSVAAYYPLGAISIYAVANGKVLQIIRRHSKTVLVLLILAIGIPALYYVPHLLFTEHAYSEAIDHELLRRFNRGFHNQLKWDYYFQTIKGGSIIPPLSLALAAIYFAFQGIVRRKKEFLFVLIWAALPLIAYSPLHSRLVWYIAPCFLPFALMVGETTRVTLKELFLRFKSFKGPFSQATAWQLVLIFFCLFYASSSLIKGSRAIYRTGENVLKENPRLPIDVLSQDILKALRNKKILSYQVPAVATVEHVYMNMLKPFFEEALSAEDFKKQIGSGRFAFAITSVEVAEPIIKSHSSINYTVLGANTVDGGWLAVERLQPLVFFSFVDDSNIHDHFHPSIYQIDFSHFPDENLHYGWSEKRGAGNARVMIGSASSVFIPADAILEHTGAQISLKLARNGSSTDPGLSASLLINSKPVGEIKNIAPDFTWSKFDVPPQILKEGKKNVLQFIVKYEDGREISNGTWTVLVATMKISPPNL